MEKKISIFTDGSCKGNPGPGGFGVVIMENDEIKHTYSERCDNTTNNREELKAIIYALQYADEIYPKENVTIYSDSSYCVNACNDWIWNWARACWKNSKKITVENLDLIQIIYGITNRDFYHCQIVKIKGHDGKFGNELADALATDDTKKYDKIINDKYINNNSNLIQCCC